jgi:hypothetical protein
MIASQIRLIPCSCASWRDSGGGGRGDKDGLETLIAPVIGAIMAAMDKLHDRLIRRCQRR